VDRRRFLLISLASVLATPRGTAAQQGDQIPKVGYLSPGSPSDPMRLRRFGAFRQGLRDLGHVEGQNIAIESRWAEGNCDRYPALAADLVRVKSKVIAAVGGAASQATQRATKTIPIVMSVVLDPVGSRLVASLARPEGNITGLSLMAPDIVGKQLQLLKEAVPSVSRVAVLWNPANPGSAPQLREMGATGRTLKTQLQVLEARVPQEIDSAFAAMRRERAGAVVILADAIFTNQRRQIAELSMKGRLPSIYGVREYAEAGGLMDYSVDSIYMKGRAAIYVDKILKGAKLADLPIEQPTKFELVINLKTAKALGLTIPPSLLARAAQVIE
jgi:putative tryptophan/tyrosine transport system substrate-binding protein